MYREARYARNLRRPDEVHRMVVARRLLRDPHGAARGRERSGRDELHRARASRRRAISAAPYPHTSAGLLRVRAEAGRRAAHAGQSLSDMRQGDADVLRVRPRGGGARQEARAFSVILGEGRG